MLIAIFQRGAVDGLNMLVPFGDIPALAAAMSEIGADPARAQQMGQAARARILRVFSWAEAGRNIAETLEEVVHAHRRSRAA